jgi:DHA1 family tetracycline resistance protein-like MFS transporter
MMGMASSAIIYICYGLTTNSNLLYFFILANFLSFAAGPALQTIISKAASEREQGLTQGSLNAINSIMIIIAPLIGTFLLAKVSHLPKDDWRMGITFFVCSGLQFLAVILALVHFRRLRKIV